MMTTFPVYWVTPADWTLDTTFEQWIWFNGEVARWIAQDNDNYYVTSYPSFTSYNWNYSVTSNKIAPFIRVDATTYLPDNSSLFWENFNTWSLNGNWWIKNQSFAVNWDNIYVIWWFTKYKWQSTTHIAVLDKTTLNLSVANTWVWFTFFGSPFWWLHSCIYYVSWKLLVANSFWLWYNWWSSTRLHVINPNDLSIDSELTTFINPSSMVERVFVQSDWKIVLVWQFTTICGISKNRIVRLNSDWTLDTTFNTNVGTAWWWAINDIIELSTGELVLTWDFTTFNWSSTQRVVKLNNDWTVNTLLASWLGGSWRCITKDSSDNIYISWTFTSVSWSSRTYVVKLNSSLVIDGTFNPVVTNASGIWVIQVDWDNLYLWINASNTTQTVNWSNVYWLAVVHKDSWALLSNMNWWINKWLTNTSTIQYLEKNWDYIYISFWVNFSTYAWLKLYNWNTVSTTAVISKAWLLKNAFSDHSWTELVWTLVEWSNKYMYGNFAKYNTLTTSVLKYDTDFDYSFLIPLSNSRINKIIYDNWLVIWWAFTSPKNRIIKYDATWVVDATFDVWTWFNNTVVSIIKLSTGKYLVSWTFTTYKWVAQNRIVRLNTDWSVDEWFVAWTWPNVWCDFLELQDGNYLVWGSKETWSLTTWKWNACNRIIKVSPTWDIISFLTNNITATTIMTCLEHNWKIYVIWVLSNDWTNAVSWIACYTTTWTPINLFWTKFTTTSWTAYCSWGIIHESKLVVVWNFTAYDWTPVGNIARIFI